MPKTSKMQRIHPIIPQINRKSNRSTMEKYGRIRLFKLNS